MVPPTRKQLSTKQIDLLLFLLKLRAATIFQLIHYFYPELKGKDRYSREYENARKSISRILKRLQDVGYITKTRPDQTYEVFYSLTAKGQYKGYDYLGIDESATNNRSGFDFELGYFPKEKFSVPTNSAHSRFQTEVQAYIMWLNRYVSTNESGKWIFGNVELTNICSFRDNLHASSRDSEIHEKDEYKPDGEVRMNCSRYEEDGTLISADGDISHYFLEHDLNSERGAKLESKFERLKLHMAQLMKNGQHHLYKGMIVILPEEENSKKKSSSGFNVTTRYNAFVEKFNNICLRSKDEESKRTFKDFNLIATSIDNLDKTLLSLRTEFSHTFFDRLKESWLFPGLNPTFMHDITKVFPLNPAHADTYGHFTKDLKYFCVFINIEGLNTSKWNYAIQAYQDIKRPNPNVKYKIVPIVTFSELMPFAPQLLGKNVLNAEEKEFFDNLYLLDLRIKRRPVFYKQNQPIDFHEAEFINES